MEARRYALGRKLASGGMATVHLGRGPGPLGFERPVAIKICHPHLLDDARKAAMLDEARVAARIRHPNVVATLDAIECEGSLWIVMEYVDGLTVAGLLRDRALPLDVALRIAEDTLAGLQAVHAHDVVHRDVSPQNILVGVDGFAKLADFGVFKGRDRLAPSTETGDLKGKLGYIAPEVYRGEAITSRVDVYAMGVVLWEMLAGRRLFEEDTHAAAMHRTLRGWVPPLTELRPDVPPELDGILARALALDPADRWPTAEEFARALDALDVKAASTRTVGEHVRAVMPTPPVETTHDSLTPTDYVTPSRPLRPRSRSRARIATVAAIAAPLISVIAIVALVSKRPAFEVRAGQPPAPVVVVEALSQEAGEAAIPVVSASALPGAPTVQRHGPAKPKAKPAAASSVRPFYDPEKP